MSTAITQDQFVQNQLKIDEMAVEGLGGTKGSLAYKIAEIEGHLHSAGRFFGSGGVNATALLNITPWVLTSGNGTFGATVQLFDGSEDFDLPFAPDWFDPHRLFVEDASDDGFYKVRIANSAMVDGVDTYATMAEAVAAKVYSENVVGIANDKSPEISLPIQTGRAMAGSKVWAQVWSSVNGATVSIMLGIHGYEG